MPKQGNASSVTRIVSLFCTWCVSIRAQEPLITGCWVFEIFGFFCDILVCCFATPGMEHTKTKVFWSKAIVQGACFHCQCCVISSRFLPQDKCYEAGTAGGPRPLYPSFLHPFTFPGGNCEVPGSLALFPFPPQWLRSLSLESRVWERFSSWVQVGFCLQELNSFHGVLHNMFLFCKTFE